MMALGLLYWGVFGGLLTLIGGPLHLILPRRAGVHVAMRAGEVAALAHIELENFRPCAPQRGALGEQGGIEIIEYSAPEKRCCRQEIGLAGDGLAAFTEGLMTSDSSVGFEFGRFGFRALERSYSFS